MKRFTYRLVMLEFDGTWYEDQTNGHVTRGLEPGERIIKVFNDPEHNSTTNNWYLSVLVEKEVTCFPITDMDQEKLTKMLKGEQRG